MTEIAQKIHVVFVDDEPLVLQGLQRMLRPMRNEWEMTFVESGERALAILNDTPCQVVVSDMRMPGMDGATLLARVKEVYPKTVRLILSGHADKGLIMKCVGTAHQFLAKPCEPDALRIAIARASAFNSSVTNERIKMLVGRMDRLPSVPALLTEMVGKLRSDNCCLGDVAEVIRKDIAMTAKLLKLVNSAFFGLRRQISDPSDAISYLGLETIKALVLSLDAFSAFEGSPGNLFRLESLWAHSLKVATLSKEIARDFAPEKGIVDESYLGGMLHDLGKLILASNLPEDYSRAVAYTKESGVSACAAEEKFFGANHADIGGYLLSLWGLPVGVVDAITFHHSPESNPEKTFTAATAVHIADALCLEKEAPSGNSLLNIQHLKSLHLDSRIEAWRQL